MTSDSGMEAHAFDNRFCVKPFHFGIGVEFIKKAYTKSQICICEQFYRLRLYIAHNQLFYILRKRRIRPNIRKTTSFCTKNLIF